MISSGNRIREAFRMYRKGISTLPGFNRGTIEALVEKKRAHILLSNFFSSFHESKSYATNEENLKVDLKLRNTFEKDGNVVKESHIFYYNGEGDSIRDESLSAALSSITVFPEIINNEEASILLSRCEQSFKRKRYIKDHWDGVISYYRETEILESDWNNIECTKILERIKNGIRNFFSENAEILKKYDKYFEEQESEHKTLDTPYKSNDTTMVEFRPIHVLDLHSKGYISPHVDSVRHGGKSVCGVSLLSPSVMRLNQSVPEEYNLGESNKGRDEDINTHKIDLYLPPNSLYILSGPTRFEYTHEILKDEESFFRGKVVPRDRRISLIFRDIV